MTWFFLDFFYDWHRQKLIFLFDFNLMFGLHQFLDHILIFLLLHIKVKALTKFPISIQTLFILHFCKFWFIVQEDMSITFFIITFPPLRKLIIKKGIPCHFLNKVMSTFIMLIKILYFFFRYLGEVFFPTTINNSLTDKSEYFLCI